MFDPYGIIEFGHWNEVFNTDNPNSVMSKYKKENNPSSSDNSDDDKASD